MSQGLFLTQHGAFGYLPWSSSTIWSGSGSHWQWESHFKRISMDEKRDKRCHCHKKRPTLATQRPGMPPILNLLLSHELTIGSHVTSWATSDQLMKAMGTGWKLHCESKTDLCKMEIISLHKCYMLHFKAVILSHKKKKGNLTWSTSKTW